MKIEVRPGAGGAESKDAARMIWEMYGRWLDRAGFRLWRSRRPGRFTITVNAYGAEALRQEAGIHRLVRLSPHDPERRRHTSFVAVVVDGECPDAAPRRSYVLHPYERVTDHITNAMEHPSLVFSGVGLDRLWKQASTTPEASE
jgi:protein subunit release factor A